MPQRRQDYRHRLRRSPKRAQDSIIFGFVCVCHSGTMLQKLQPCEKMERLGKFDQSCITHNLPIKLSFYFNILRVVTNTHDSSRDAYLQVCLMLVAENYSARHGV